MKKNILVVAIAMAAYIVWPSLGVVHSQDRADVLDVDGVPHQPNFLGKNICLGIEANRNIRRPVIISSTTLSSQRATHRLIFDNSNEIDITEDIVSEKQCEGLPIDKVRWSDSGRALFCMKSWENGKFVKVSFKTNFSLENHDNKLILMSIYSIGPCQIGDVSSGERAGLFYGEALKVGSMPVHSPENIGEDDP